MTRPLALLLVLVALPLGVAADSELPSPAPPPESEGRPDHRGAWDLAEAATLRALDGGAWLSTGSGPTELVAFLAEPPSLSDDGRRFVLVGGDPDAFCPGLQGWTLAEGRWTARVLDGEGCPDRASISPDGARVAYVSDRTGIASLWVVDFDGGAPRQVTNVGIERLPITIGHAPEGFVPPPYPDPPRWEGSRLRWDSQDGPGQAALP